MAIIKSILALIGLLMISVSYAQEQTEIERKYVGEKLIKVQKYAVKNNQLGDFGLHHHSSYAYFDIYFDTPQKDLLRNGLSLRMRFQNKPGAEDSLGFMFQLKSEMSYAGAERYEMEETELDFYLIDFRGERTTIAALLQLFFSETPSEQPTPQQADILTTIYNWFRDKSGAPIAPFQGLKHLLPEVFSNEKIASLTAAAYGMTARQRIHVFMRYPQQDSILRTLEKRERPKSSLPEFFQTNSDTFWLMEASFDQSYFHRVSDNGSLHQLRLEEFEVEKKYSKNDGAEIMNSFESELLKKFELQSEIRSKYKQLMEK